MKFKSLPVLSLEDATVNFEQLSALAILNLTAARGSATVAFPNAQQATTLTVTHSLGATPAAGFATVAGGVFGANITPYLGTFTGTQFALNAFSSVVINGNVTFFWLLIG